MPPAPLHPWPQVHPYTLRDEPQFVPTALAGRVALELRHLFERERVHGVFADFPGSAVEWLRQEGPPLDALMVGGAATGASPAALQREL